MLRLPPGGGAPVMVAVTGLIRPTGMVLAPSGDLYISDTGNNRVVRVPGDGGPRASSPPPTSPAPSGWH